MPEAGIVINTCNRVRPLHRIVNNCFDQKDDADTVIVVNDGEEGNLPDLPDGVVVIEQNSDYYGLPEGRNLGWRNAAALDKDYCVFFDDDMVLEHSCLIKHREAQEDDHEFCQGKIVTRKTGLYDIRFFGDYQALKLRKDEEEKWAEMIEQGELSYGGSNISISIDALEEVDGWDKDFTGKWGWEDRDIVWRLWEAGYKIKFLLDAIVTHMELPVEGDYRRFSGKNYKLFCEKHPDFPQPRSYHGQRR